MDNAILLELLINPVLKYIAAKDDKLNIKAASNAGRASLFRTSGDWPDARNKNSCGRGTECPTVSRC